VVRGGVVSATYMDGAYGGVAVSPDGNYVFVTGQNTDSVAVIDVTTKTGYSTQVAGPFCIA
jgi:DNA-binding beta-propeller fold protein YncE